MLRGAMVRREGKLTQPPTAVARGRVERTRQSLKGIFCIVEQSRYVVIFKESSVGGSRSHQAVFPKRSSGQQALGALASEEPGKESVVTSRIFDVRLFAPRAFRRWRLCAPTSGSTSPATFSFELLSSPEL